jgi:hypothetical protein
MNRGSPMNVSATMPSMRSPTPLLTAAALLVPLLSSLLWSPPARADELFQSLVGRVNKPLLDPAGYFAVVLPAGFDCEASPRRVRCQGNRGVQSLLTIDVVDVPASASVELLLLNQMDAYQKKPHFKLLSQKKLTIDGQRALFASFTFDHFGNVQLPGGAQALYLVKNTKAYIIHYEGRADQFAVHKKDLDEVYATFKTARLDGGGNPIVEDLKPKAPKARTDAELDRALSGGF